MMYLGCGTRELETAPAYVNQTPLFCNRIEDCPVPKFIIEVHVKLDYLFHDQLKICR